jgi:hypothetical protein
MNLAITLDLYFSVYNSEVQTKKNRAMNLRDIVLNYLIDNEKGMEQLITLFLNDVMNEEVAQQAGVPGNARSGSRRVHRNSYRSRSLKTQFGAHIRNTQSPETAITRTPV